MSRSVIYECRRARNRKPVGDGTMRSVGLLTHLLICDWRCDGRPRSASARTRDERWCRRRRRMTNDLVRPPSRGSCPARSAAGKLADRYCDLLSARRSIMFRCAGVATTTNGRRLCVVVAVSSSAGRPTRYPLLGLSLSSRSHPIGSQRRRRRRRRVRLMARGQAALVNRAFRVSSNACERKYPDRPD